MEPKKLIQPATLLIFLLLSVFGGPDLCQLRSLETLWNLGHIFLFGLLAWTLLKSKRFKTKSLGWKTLHLFLITIIIGITIEFLQYKLSSGNPDLDDLGRNFIGSALPLVFGQLKALHKQTRFFMQLIVLILVAIQIKPVVLMALDECRALIQFPELSNFESTIELSRWSGGANFSISNQYVIHGKHALKVRLNTDQYSGVSLDYFPSDWSGYKFLRFSVYNPDQQALKLVCRIHDSQHNKNDFKYSDRFSQEIRFHPGWNLILIDLKDVQRAPKSRKMDLTQIQNWALFAVRLPAQQEFFLDHLFLANR
jgi:hypothetical protein